MRTSLFVSAFVVLKFTWTLVFLSDFLIIFVKLVLYLYLSL
jgi:hypothetical protein